MKSRAAVLNAPGEPFRIEELELEEPRDGEVLVAIEAAGVCHSDWHLVTGATPHPMPVVAGHEGAGVVEACGAGVEGLAAGDHVVLSWAPSCGACFYCERGQRNLCQTWLAALWRGTMIDGTPRLSRGGSPVYHYCGLAAFAERAVVPAASCVKVGADVAPAVAALVGCAVSTGVGAVLHTADVAAGDRVIVIGCGGVGLSIVQAARLREAGAVIAVDRSSERLELARRLGATEGLTDSQASIARLRELTEGRGGDVVFEAVGSAALQRHALEATRPGGMVVLVGLSPSDEPTDVCGAALTRQEKTVKGSYYGSIDPRRDFPRILELHREGRLDLDALVSREYALEDINEAYREMLAGRGARGVLVLNRPADTGSVAFGRNE